MKVVKTSPGCNLFLGHQGEKLALQIVFDVAPWLETYGFGTAHLLHQRKGDAEPYPVATTQEGNEVRWDVSNSDTAVEGAGRYELHFYTGETLVKSVTGDTLTAGALQYGVDPPEPVQLWLDHVAEKEHELFQAVEQSDAAAKMAQQYAGLAENYEVKAKDHHDKAANARNEALQYAQTAGSMARSASASAERSASAADAAERIAQAVPQTVEAALKQAKESGEFNGPPGDDYILTKADKEEIAEQAAALVDVPEYDVVKTVNGLTPDENGNVQIEVSSGSGVEVTAKPGQLIRVKEVDGNGNPTAWEAVPWGYTEHQILLEESDASPYNAPGLGQMWLIFDPPALTVGETYTVTYNGKSYDCECIVAPSGIVDDSNAVALGNCVLLNGNDTGEPFAIIVSNKAVNILDIPTFTGSAAPTSVRVGIKGKVAHPIPGELLPEIPTFDLSEMGMPPVSFTEQTDWVQADITQLCDALDKGVVKLKYAFDMGGMQLPAVDVVGAKYLAPSDMYMVTSIATMNGAVVMSAAEFDRANNSFRMRLYVLGG